MRMSRTLILSTWVALATVVIARSQDYDEKISPSLRDAIRASGEDATVRAWVYFADKSATKSESERALTERARARRERNGVAVDVRDLPVAAAYVREVRSRGARVRHVSRWLNAVSVEATPRELLRIETLAFVRRLDRVRGFREPVFPGSIPALPPKTGAEMEPSAPPRDRTLALDYGPSLTQNALINVPSLHNQGYSGAGVLIASLDAGFNNLEHEALVDLDVLATWDFVNNDPNVDDQVGQAGTGNHGTVTLSALAGFEPGDLIGPAYGATFILAKTENTDWERHVEEDDWIAGAEWADSIGADIISSSLGYSTGFTNGDADYSWTDMDGNTTIVALGADIAASRGILVVNSAGNAGFVSLPANTLVSPADGDSVLAIGAVDQFGARSGFSSVGPSADGQIKPDVMAMGSGVIAASPFNTTAYSSTSGTSLSCPLVAGVAALLLEIRPSATITELMDALRQTASQANTPNREYGYGIVDALAASNWILSDVGHAPRPGGSFLHPAHPNPFNPTTTIRYELATSSRVNLSVYDVRGALVATLVDQVQPAGAQSLTWDATDRNGNALASGVYLCRLVANGENQTRKLVLLK